MRPAGASAIVAIALSVAVAWASVGDGRVPFDRIPPPVQERLRDVIDHAVFQRSVQGLTFRSREPVFLYFLDHPDFAAAVARTLKVAQYRVEPRSGGTYWGDDARGAAGIFEVVYADPHKRVVYAQGTYDTPWLPTIYGRIVLVLDFEHRNGSDGQSQVTSDLKGYLRVDNPFLDLLARLVGPIVGSAVDRKVARSFGIAAKVSERAYDDPRGFLQALRNEPDIDRRHLAALAARLGQADGTYQTIQLRHRDTEHAEARRSSSDDMRVSATAASPWGNAWDQITGLARTYCLGQARSCPKARAAWSGQ